MAALPINHLKLWGGSLRGPHGYRFSFGEKSPRLPWAGKTPVSLFGDSIRPFSISQWAREEARLAGTPESSRCFGRVKLTAVDNSPLRLAIYHLLTAISIEIAQVPLKFEDWCDLVVRFSLLDMANLGASRAVFQRL